MPRAFAETRLLVALSDVAARRHGSQARKKLASRSRVTWARAWKSANSGAVRPAEPQNGHNGAGISGTVLDRPREVCCRVVLGDDCLCFVVGDWDAPRCPAHCPRVGPGCKSGLQGVYVGDGGYRSQGSRSAGAEAGAQAAT